MAWASSQNGGWVVGWVSRGRESQMEAMCPLRPSLVHPAALLSFKSYFFEAITKALWFQGEGEYTPLLSGAMAWFWIGRIAVDIFRKYNLFLIHTVHTRLMCKIDLCPPWGSSDLIPLRHQAQVCGPGSYNLNQVQGHGALQLQFLEYNPLAQVFSIGRPVNKGDESSVPHTPNNNGEVSTG